jgi:hypothetical protein
MKALYRAPRLCDYDDDVLLHKAFLSRRFPFFEGREQLACTRTPQGGVRVYEAYEVKRHHHSHIKVALDRVPS